MVKKTKIESDVYVKNLRQRLKDKMPAFMGPNGGSLNKIQEEHVNLYNLIVDLIDSLDETAFIKKEVI